jgi:hypothetical protein
VKYSLELIRPWYPQLGQHHRWSSYSDVVVVFLHSGHLNHTPSGVSFLSLVEVWIPSRILLNQLNVLGLLRAMLRRYRPASFNKCIQTLDLSGNGHFIAQVHILDTVQDTHAFFHRALECFPSADKSHTAGSLVHHSGGNGFRQIAGTGGCTA